MLAPIAQLKVAAESPLAVRLDAVHNRVAPALTLTVPWGLPSPETPVTVPVKVWVSAL